MKLRLLLIATGLSVLSSSGAATTTIEDPAYKAYRLKVEMLRKVSQMSRPEFERMLGKKLTSNERILFKSAKEKLKASFDKNGSLNNSHIDKLFKKPVPISGFHLGGFALGVGLGLIGVLIANNSYNKDDNKLKKNRLKWAWIGAGVQLIGIILIAVVTFS